RGLEPLWRHPRGVKQQVIGVGGKGSPSAMPPPACDEFLFYHNPGGVDMRPAGEPAPFENGDAEESGPSIEALVTTTLAGLMRSGQGETLAYSLKRAILRKDPTFSETDCGFRAFGELLRHVEEQGVIELSEGPGRGDPIVQFASGGGEQQAFGVLHEVVESLSKKGPVVLSGLKNQMRKRLPDFSEKKFGYGGFLQFCKAAAARGLISLDWDDELGDYR